MENIDYESLRKDLIDYFGIAMFNSFPMAIMDLSKVENATHEELLKIAQNQKIDQNKYKIKVKK